MTYSFANKLVSIGGKTVVTDWKKVTVVSPDNLQNKVKSNEIAKKVVKNERRPILTPNSIRQVI